MVHRDLISTIEPIDYDQMCDKYKWKQIGATKLKKMNVQTWISLTSWQPGASCASVVGILSYIGAVQNRGTQEIRFNNDIKAKMDLI